MILRCAGVDDAAAVARIYAPYVTGSDISFETEAPDPAAMAERIAARRAQELPWIVAEDATGQVMGYAYAAPYHPRHAYRFTVEPTVYVDAQAHGRGVGSALYRTLIDLLTALGYRQAIALVALPNRPSEALHRRFGFAHTGTLHRAGYKLGRWIDVALFQRPLDEGADVREPLALDACQRWDALRR